MNLRDIQNVGAFLAIENLYRVEKIFVNRLRPHLYQVQGAEVVLAPEDR